MTVARSAFVNRVKRMSGYPHRLLLITASLTQVKSPYPYAGNPNRVFQSLVALLAGINVPFLCNTPKTPLPTPLTSTLVDLAVAWRAFR
jgi:hypothetical protein